MPNLPHNPDRLTASQAREIAALVGHDLDRARIAAVRALIADKGGFGAALSWAASNTIEQVARDVRTLWSGLYDDLGCVRRKLEGDAAYTLGLPEAREGAARRLAVMDAARHRRLAALTEKRAA